MSDNLRTRIIEVQLSHIPIDYAGGIECACGTECQPQHGGIDVAEQMWADHVADAVIEALPDYLWRCPKCNKGYWADHGPVCNVTPPPWGSGR